MPPRLGWHFAILAGMAETNIVTAADERLIIDRGQSLVMVDGNELGSLTEDQYKILGTLATRLDTVHPNPDVCEVIWGNAGSKALVALNWQFKRLRDKMGPELGNPQSGAIRTRYAVGRYLVSTLAETEIPPAEAYTVSSGFIKVDPVNLTVRIADEITPALSPTEFNIFDMLASQPGTTISHNDLYLRSWGKSSLLGMETLKVVIGRLRRKLGKVYGDPKNGIIRNEFNKGYYLLDKDRE
jgi:DNA-binding response OmpR family regulator